MFFECVRFDCPISDTWCRAASDNRYDVHLHSRRGFSLCLIDSLPRDIDVN